MINIKKKKKEGKERKTGKRKKKEGKGKRFDSSMSYPYTQMLLPQALQGFSELRAMRVQ